MLRTCLRTIFLLCLLFPMVSAGQALFRFMDWPGDDVCVDAERLANGRIAALLESKDANGISDACIVFLNEQGDFQKRVCLRINGVQTARAIRALPDSGYLIAGKTASNGGDCYLARFNASDSLVWLQTFGGSGDEEPQDIELNSDGHIFIAGYTRSYGPAGFNSLLLKYDPSGTLLWSRVFSTNTFDAAYRLLCIGSSCYLSCNMNVSPVFGNGDTHLMKLDSAGNIVWTRVYGTGGNEHAWNMIPTLDGHIAFLMASTGSGTNKEIVFMKIDTSGGILFSSRLENGSEALDVFDLVQDPDSSYCLSGHTFSSSSLIHALLVRIDKNGNPLKAKRSNFSLSAEIWRLIPVGPYRYLFFGYGDKQGSAGSKLFLGGSDSTLNLSCLNWQDQTITRSSSGINASLVNVFASGFGGSGQSVNPSFNSDTTFPDSYDKNKNPSINTLLPTSRVLCEVDSLLLDPGNFQYYQWENGSVQRLAYADTFGMYRVKVFTQSCFNIDSVQLSAGTPVPIHLSKDTCGRDSLKLRVNPIFGHQYSWDFNPGNYEGYVKEEGWYTVEAYEAIRNCRVRDSIFVKLSPNELRLYSDTFSLCLDGNFIELNTQNNYQLPGDQHLKTTWWLDQAKIDSQANLVYSAKNAGWKNILAVSKSKKGCIDSAMFRYHIHHEPEAIIDLSDSQVCLNELPVHLNDLSNLASGSYRRSWYVDGIKLSNEQAFFPYSPVGSGLYEIDLILVSDSGCRDTMQHSLEVFPAPLAKIYLSSPNPQCHKRNLFTFRDSSIWPGGTGTYTLNWQSENPADLLPGADSVAVNFQDLGKGKINLFLETPNGCKDSASFDVMVLESPQASLVLSDSQTCEAYGKVSLSNSSSFSGQSTSTLFLPDGSSLVPFSSYSTSYSLALTYLYQLIIEADNGCTDTVFKAVEVFPKPKFDVITDSLIPCLDENKLVLSIRDLRNSINKINMDYGDGSTQSQAPFVHQFENFGVYQLAAIAENLEGCLDTQVLSIRIFPSPQADFQVEPACLGEESRFISKAGIAAGSIDTSKWTFGDGTSGTGIQTSHLYGLPGDYSISQKVVSDKGCTDSLFIADAARVRDVVPAGFTIDTLQVGYDRDLFRFSGTNPGAVLHEWRFSSGESFYDRVIEFGVRDSARLIVHYRTVDSFSCISEIWDTLFVDFNRLLAIPNAFSPNNDELNRVFKPHGAKFNFDYYFIILNRWGEIIFETHDPEIGWDGTFGGNPCPVDIYVYQITIDKGRYQYYGTVHLLR